MADIPSPFFTYTEVATLLKYSKSRLYELVRNGCIPTCRIGGKTLFRVSDINTVIASGFHLPGTFTHEPTVKGENGRRGAKARYGDRMGQGKKRPVSAAARLRPKKP